MSSSEPIRSSIEYAYQRFYRLHQESFVFSALASLSPLFLKVDDATSARIMAKALSKLLDALSMHSIDAVDVSGIRGTNEAEESELATSGAFPF